MLSNQAHVRRLFDLRKRGIVKTLVTVDSRVRSTAVPNNPYRVTDARLHSRQKDSRCPISKDKRSCASFATTIR
jgi:hypothetical protein